MNKNPAFYITTPNVPNLIHNYGWYAVFSIGKLSIIDRRESQFGKLYTTSKQMIEEGGITTDKQFYELMADGALTQIKSPIFVVWEVGQEKPFSEKYFSLEYACKKAHSMAVSEPQKQTIKEKTNV
jgi:hypothetical protein